MTESYYGRPILKEPVWKPEVPLYFFTGGLAGASSVLSFAARIARRRRLAKTSLYVATAAELVSPALLVSDLGRPERFLNMLRVFKVTSPMSVGSWILAASGASTTAEAACEALGVLPRLRLLPAALSAALGAPLATYTAALVSDTAVPVWHEARRELPFVFGASACATAAAAATMLLPAPESEPARRLAVGGVIAEGIATQAMERRLGFLGEPYRQGAAGALSRAAKASSAAGALLLARNGGTSRAASVVGGALIISGGLALRFAVFKAGVQSARDPKYVVQSQRARPATTR